MHSVSVAGVVHRDDGRVLCLRRRDTGSWQIPGGVLVGRRRAGVSVPVTDRLAPSTAEAVETAWLTVDKVRERSVPAFAIRVVDALRTPRADVAGPGAVAVHEVAVRAQDGERLLAPRVRLDARSTVPGPE